jgi:hypothetical protein
MFRKSRLTRNSTILSIVFLLGTFFLPLWRILPFKDETPFIALHYNIYLGVDRFGPIHQILFLPALGLFLLVLNLLIQSRVYKQQKVLSYFFAASNPLLQFILLVAMGLIVLVNL